MTACLDVNDVNRFACQTLVVEFSEQSNIVASFEEHAHARCCHSVTVAVTKAMGVL